MKGPERVNKLEDRVKQLEERVERIRNYLKGERQKLLDQQQQALAEERKIVGSRGRAASENDVIAYCLEQGLTEQDGTFFWCRWESSGVGGWYNAGKKIRDWKMVIRQWKAGSWCPSQKQKAQGVRVFQAAAKPAIDPARRKQLRDKIAEVSQEVADHEAAGRKETAEALRQRIREWQRQMND